jgi:hypothetical protein
VVEPVVLLNGVQIHPPNPDGTGYELDEDGLQGWYGSPKPKTAYTSKTADAGSWWSPLAYDDVRPIVATGELVQADSATFLDAQLQLAAICPDPSQLYTLQVTDDSGTLTAQVQRSDAILVKALSNVSTGFSFSLTAPDPYKYDPNLTPVTTALALSGGGLDWSTGGGLSWPLNWGTSTSDGTFTLATIGTAPSWPVFTVSGPTDSGTLSGISITCADTGQVIAYSGTLGVGDTLVITTNPATRSVVLNGSADVWSGLVVSEWFAVPAGGQVSGQFQGLSGSATPQLSAVAPNTYF